MAETNKDAGQIRVNTKGKAGTKPIVNQEISVPKKKGKGHKLEILPPEWRARVKFAYTTRRVPNEIIAGLLPSKGHPHSGDLVLAQVLKLGQHEHIEMPNGRRARLYQGDEIVVAFGNRYAPDQFEAIVPERLVSCHLVAAGGIAGQMIQKHTKMKNPTTIMPIGLLGDSQGHRINLMDWALSPMIPDPSLPRPSTIVVAGTSMNSGKTTAISCLTRGLVSSGYRVAAAKLTGTGAGRDQWQMIDAGASPVLDFVDAGAASTYRLNTEELNRVTGTLLSHLFGSNVDMVLLEISDGLLEQETARLLTSPEFRPFVDAVVFTASDALGAAAGVAWLRENGLPVVAVSGVLTSSPLAMREALASAEIPIHQTESLIKSEVAGMLRECVLARTSSNKIRAAKQNKKIGPK